MGWGTVEQRWFSTFSGLLQVGKETYGNDFLYRVSDSEGEVWGLKIKNLIKQELARNSLPAFF